MELVEVSNTVHSNWKELNLGESAILKARIGWQGLTTAEYLDTGNYYLITGTDFKNGFIDWDNCVFVEKNRYDQDRNIQVQVGDVLVTKDGTIGKVAFVDKVPKPTTLNSGVFVIRPKNKAFDTKYFYYVLMSNHFSEFLTRLTAGSTISHLYQKDFVHYSFPLPPLPEQKAIAQVLSDTDNLIQAIEQKLTKKRAIKQGAMQQLLTPKEDWEFKKLGEVSTMSSGGTPSSKIAEYYDGKILWVSISDITKAGKFINDSAKKITEKGLLNSSAKIFSKNTVLLAMYASIGKCCIATEEVSTSQAILGIEVKKQLLNEYLYYFLLFNREVLASQGQQGTQSNLNKGMVENIDLPLPKYEEQSQIVTILSDIDADIEQLEHKLSKYRMVKQGLMQNLLTGKIRLV